LYPIAILFSDQVDRIILDKPHFHDNDPLDVMKFIPDNIERMNEKYKYMPKKRQITTVKNTTDSNHGFGRSSKPIDKKEPINEADLEKEVYRLQNYLKQMNEDFALQRRQLEDDCSKQLKTLNENADKTRRLQEELEQGIRLIEKKKKFSFDFVFLSQIMQNCPRNMNLSNVKMMHSMINI
jgi:transcription initiation factor IIF auxiliary subunit